MNTIITPAVLHIFLALTLWGGMDDGPAETKGGSMQNTATQHKITLEDLSLVVCYDNYLYQPGLKTAWGFSCFITGPEKTILFDTGGDSPTLLSNMEALQLDPQDIDIIVLSHNHGDHTGGLGGILEKNTDVVVYVPASFPAGITGQVEKAGAELVKVSDPAEICRGVYSVGEMGAAIREQSMVMDTDEGLLVITGCAHPGIVKIVGRARELYGEKVLLAMGGFHLGSDSRNGIEDIIRSLRQMGVQYAAPSHCSGDNARALFAKEYGEKYIELGAGRKLKGEVLK